MTTPAKKRSALSGGKFVQVDDGEVDLELDSMNRTFGSHINLIPLQSAVAGSRLFYGARFMNQAMPLVNREAPLVQAAIDGDPDGRSFDDHYGSKMGVVHSRHDGVVKSITPDEIELQVGKGTKKIALYNNMPLNRKSGLSSIPAVKVGDRIKAGQLLASSNYTDPKGTLALGLNARVGLVPYKGYSMDDSVVISEAFAKRMSQEAMYGHDIDYKRGVKGGKAHYAGLFPQKFINTQLANLDDDGVIRPGMVVNHGDPIILATRPKTISSQAKQLGNLSSHMKNARSDASVVWDHEEPGTVTDVKKLKSGARVNISVVQPAKVGDKIAGRSGQKSFHPDTEVLTERGWVGIGELCIGDRVAALFNENEIQFVEGNGRRKNSEQQHVARFVTPMDYHSYVFDGELYGLEASHVSYLVTGNHRIWRKGHAKNCKDWYCIDAKRVHGSSHNFMIRAPFDLSDRVDPVEFVIAQATHGLTGLQMDCVCRFPFKAWVKFMAMYLAEGNIRHDRPNSHEIKIAQKEKPFCREVEATLDEMGLHWTKVNNQYVTESNKALRMYLEQFGYAADKFVPSEIKRASSEIINLFLDTIWMCDGDKEKGKRFYTSSPKMVNDIQELLALNGKAVSVARRPAREHQNHDAYTLHILEYECIGTRKNYKQAFYKQKYHGPVHCIQVPGEGVILTRLHGKTVWNGNSIISLLLPENSMPRTVDGKPLEVLLNPLGIPSRVNNSLIYELYLGKLAAKTGQPYKVPGFNGKDEKWYEMVEKELARHGVSKTEEVFDPVEHRKLERPINVGNMYFLKLSHTAESKISTRGQGSYDVDAQPSRGGSELAQAKRTSGLETSALRSSGAYQLLKEGVTLRGEKNDAYWQALREGKTPQAPGTPFAWHKFHALLNGAGLHARSLPGGTERLTFWTEKDLDKARPIEVKTGDLVDLDTLNPVKGGLFDAALTGLNSWGYIKTPHPVINPAAESIVMKLLGLTEKQYNRIIAGEEDLPMQLLMKKNRNDRPDSSSKS